MKVERAFYLQKNFYALSVAVTRPTKMMSIVYLLDGNYLVIVTGFERKLLLVGGGELNACEFIRFQGDDLQVVTLGNVVFNHRIATDPDEERDQSPEDKGQPGDSTDEIENVGHVVRPGRTIWIVNPSETCHESPFRD